MSQLEHPTLLTHLIIAAEAAIQMRHGFHRERLAEITEAIEHEFEKPVDGDRVIDTAVVMCAHAVYAADGHLRGHAREKARPFVQVTGVLLPEVRGRLELAIERRKRPTP